MWYFSRNLGLGLALTFGILNAIWYEIIEGQAEARLVVSRSRAAQTSDVAGPATT